MAIKTKIIKVNIDNLKETEHNPRQINKDDFEKLKKSLKEFPEMRKLREVIVDENFVILGGHQRVKALKDLGENEIEVKQVEGLTDAQKREFVIKDNVESGDWDFDELANAWSDLDLETWGLKNIPTLSLDVSDDDFLQDTEITKEKEARKEVVCPACKHKFNI